MTDAYVYGGLRSPIGRHGGVLAGLRPDDLAAQIIAAVLAASPFPAEAVEDVLLGCACQAGEDGRNIARGAGLLAGLPVSAGGQTVNRLCGSGLAAVVDAARAVRCGEGDLFVAGGVESMTRAPFVLAKADSAWSRDGRIYDTSIGARFPNPRFIDRFGNHGMAETAEEVARELGLDRDAADAFALRSQSLYAQALADGFFDGEIQPVALPARKGAPVMVAADEHPRPGTDAASLARLRPLAEGGVVTAGNASGINDGAAALLIGSRDAGERVGARPLGRVLGAAVAGVEPRLMGLGPVPATAKVLQRTGLSLDDMDVIELNEAFAVQVLGCLVRLGLSPDDPRLNLHGGAIAIGHPLGATGARLLLTALRALQRRDGRYALVTLCIGIGQGLAVVVERV